MNLSASLVLALLVLSLSASPGWSIDPPVLLKESVGSSPAGAPPPCGPIESVLDGNCANYRWYNVCSGYIWALGLPCGDAYGTIFRSGELSWVAPGNVVKRAITYYRNVVPNYNNTVDVHLDSDPDDDGCPPFVTVASDLRIDPGLRWNCSNFGVAIPGGVTSLVVRSVPGCGSAPRLATDGPFTAVCDPNGSDHSYYYNAFTGACLPWRHLSPTGRGDNFLTWLVIDGQPGTAIQEGSWGQIKGLFR